MKHKFFAFCLAVGLLTTSVGAVGYQVTRASDYLIGYGVSLTAQGDGLMEIYYEVDGKGIMEKVGAQAFYIDEYVNGEWESYDTLYGGEHQEYYDYDALGHTGFAYFTGEPGVDYRVTLKAYARGYDGGFDTGLVTSQTETCY